MSLETFDLYIPHGSDETNSAFKLSALDKSLYIPHGSDETLMLEEST